MCPALILAAKRKDKVSGRTNVLVVSIKTRNGFNQSGAPSGSRWAAVAFGFLVADEIMKDSHKGNPRDSVIIKCLVNLSVYGFNPIKLVRTSSENTDLIISDEPFRFFVYVRYSWSCIVLYSIKIIIVWRAGIIQ